MKERRCSYCPCSSFVNWAKLELGLHKLNKRTTFTKTDMYQSYLAKSGKGKTVFHICLKIRHKLILLYRFSLAGFVVVHHLIILLHMSQMSNQILSLSCMIVFLNAKLYGSISQSHISGQWKEFFSSTSSNPLFNCTNFRSNRSTKIAIIV